jgi:hypothetical protein
MLLLLLIFVSVVGEVSEEKLVHNNSKRVHIGPDSIFSSFMNLRRLNSSKWLPIVSGDPV